MRLDDASHDGEAESGAEVGCLFRLPVRSEDALEIGMRNSDAGVAHGELHDVVNALSSNRDRAALRRELQRVADQIPEDLHETLAIAADVRQIRFDLADDLLLLLSRNRFVRLAHL